jgi:RNA polymerase sigma-B factor
VVLARLRSRLRRDKRRSLRVGEESSPGIGRPSRYFAPLEEAGSVDYTPCDIVVGRQPGSRRSKSHGDLEDLDAAAADYAREWTLATEELRGQLRTDLIRYCLPFAGRMASRNGGRGEPPEDLQQVARLGLINAVDRYDPDRGSFTAFAVITIRGELKRYFRDKTWGLHVNRRAQDLALESQRATAALTNTLKRHPSVAELASHLHVDEDEIRDARLCLASYTPIPLSEPFRVTGGGVG